MTGNTEATPTPNKKGEFKLDDRISIVKHPCTFGKDWRFGRVTQVSNGYPLKANCEDCEQDVPIDYDLVNQTS